MDKLSKMLCDYTEDVFDISRIVNEYTGLYAKSPEEIICEKEVYSNYLKILPTFFEYMDEQDRKILYMWTIEMKSQKQISKELKLTQQAVSSRINKFPHKFQKYFYRILNEHGMDNLVSDDLITYFPTSGESKNKLTGMPHQHYEHHGEGGYWGKKYGRKEYKTKVKCRMPEYLKVSLCTLCEKCTVKPNKDGEVFDNIS